MTDLHFGSYPFDDTDLKTIKLIEKLVKKYKVDFIAITGDLIWASSLNALEIFEELIKFLDTLEVEFAITLGNHESERENLNYLIEDFEEQDEKVKNEFKNSKELTKYKENYKNLKPYGRKELFNIIKKSKNHVKIENEFWSCDKFHYYVDRKNIRLVFLDTGSYDKYGFGLYEFLDFSSIDYLENVTKDKDSYVFCHIPFREYFDAKNKDLAVGNQDEEVCAGKINTGVFARLNFNTKTRAVYCGHDHENDFTAKYGNIILNYGRCGGYNTYGNLKRGGRIIDISGNKFKSFVVEDED